MLSWRRSFQRQEIFKLFPDEGFRYNNLSLSFSPRNSPFSLSLALRLLFVQATAFFLKVGLKIAHLTNEI